MKLILTTLLFPFNIIKWTIWTGPVYLLKYIFITFPAKFLKFMLFFLVLGGIVAFVITAFWRPGWWPW